MSEGTRVLVASALAEIIVLPLATALGGSVIGAVGDREVRKAIADRVRFDVVVADLTWNATDLEYRFDGFDVLDVLRDHGRTAPVIFAAQGYSAEHDHIDEVRAHPEIVGVIQKSAGQQSLLRAIALAARGQRLSPEEYPTGARGDGNTLHEYFSGGRRGGTAARLAGAIASGRVGDARSLQLATGIPLNTVNKLPSYLGPLITARREHPGDVPVSASSVYRWCGEHSRYLLSWCRRHGHADVATRR